jgi:polysaccharide biosynthesis protein PslH
VSGEILFLAHRIPFPPDRGDKIRSHHVLKALASLAPVHVGCLAESEEDRALEAELASLASTYCLPSRSKPLALAGVQAMLSRRPVSLAAFDSAPLRAWVARTLAERPIVAVYVFSGQMGQFVPADWQGRLVVDLVDVDSAKFEAFAAAGNGPMAWINAREGRLLRKVEADLAACADVTMLVSEEEAVLLRSRGATGHIRALRNGVDSGGFDPAAILAQGEIAARPGPHFVFSGQMDYAPNEAAVERFARHMLPVIRARHADAVFHIVGRAPTAAVLRLGDLPGVRVWGAVPDMRPFLAAADMVVAPLTIARGVQNKVLEAMAMARPVLLSPEAATGIDAVDGEHFAVCPSDAAFAETALALLSDTTKAEAIGQAARAFVVNRMSWAAMLADLPAIMGMGEGQRDAA